MNQAGVDVLVAAALAGRKQVRYRLIDGDARCALGVLYESVGGIKMSTDGLAADWISTLTFEIFDLYWAKTIFAYDLTRIRNCPECMALMRESHLITHLNDEHNWDFLAIARKLGPVEQTP